MKTVFASAAALFAVTGTALVAAPTASAQTPSATKLVSESAFSRPNAAAPSGSTIFTPVSSNNLFVTQLLANSKTERLKQGMQAYAAQINPMVQAAYARYGYEKNDLGVAFGALLETCWEMSHGSYKNDDGTAEDQAKTRVAVRQMQNALLASPTFKTTPDKNKQLFYEACTFMTGHLAVEWQKAGSDATKRAAVQSVARQQLQTLFGISADSLTRRPDGAFIRVGGKNAPTSAVSKTDKPDVKGVASANAAPVAASRGPLPAASAHGAQFFIKYTFQVTTTTFDPLILFPSGAAFIDIPSKPVSAFDEATLRASVKPFYVGTWKKSGNTLVLNFPNATRDKVVTLRKVPKGWYDGTRKLDTETAYNTYFPIIPLTPAQLAGAWKTQSLTTMGMAGGAAPMVAAGSNGSRVFNANGTFSGGSKSFASATTANMGDAFTPGGNVGVYRAGEKRDAGRWRLDGPLLTLEQNNQRTVAPAFILPNWKKSGPPDILINGDWWKRPDNK